MRRWTAAVLLGVALAGSAWAQYLDFEGVCGAPPCPAAQLYAAQGVQISPDTLEVRAGTALFRGIAGPQYLDAVVAISPVTFVLARPAVSFSGQVAAFGPTGANRTHTFVWSLAGTEVARQDVAVGSSNEWRMVTALIAGGYDRLTIFRPGVTAALGLDALHFGGGCAGFADVQPGDVFCNATEWLANRGVTLGCAGGQYCPAAGVSRAQMALFMQRLGSVLAPAFLSTTADAFGTYDTPQVLCPVATGIVPYARRALVQAGVQVAGAVAPMVAVARIVHRAGDETGWLDAAGRGFAVSLGTGEQRQVTDAAVVDLPAGRRHVLAVSLANPLLNGAIASASCELIAQVTPAPAGALPPFDAAARP